MSKANQSFKQNDEAVSPVIGVILMVAITVVLAAVVFVLVSNLGEGADEKPQVGFTKDEDGANPGGTLTVATITNGPIETDNIVIAGSATCDWVTAPASGSDLAAGQQIECDAAG